MGQKFIYFKDSKYIEEFLDFADRNVYVVQGSVNDGRIVVWPTSNAISVILDILKEFPAPYIIQYYLKTSKCNNKEWIYKSPELDYQQLSEFATKYKIFFESDGRHELCFCSKDTQGKLVYDADNLLFLYGDICFYLGILKRLGFEEYDKPIIHPDPHAHMYEDEYDDFEIKVIKHFDWINKPVRLKQSIIERIIGRFKDMFRRHS